MPVRESVCILQWKMDTESWMRFLKYVEITETCWIWTGAKNGDGYGSFGLNGKTYLAHRLALSESLGRPLRPGMDVAHAPKGICHNPSCVNPEHLREATDKENAADKRVDGTMYSKLSEADVLKIRDDPRPQTEIAADFGIAQTTVSAIKTRKTWVHII